MSPAELKILLHFYYSPDPIDFTGCVDAILSWSGCGVIRKTTAPFGSTYEVTPLGKAWVTAILNTPIPTPAFLDECGNVIKNLS